MTDRCKHDCGPGRGDPDHVRCSAFDKEKPRSECNRYCCEYEPEEELMKTKDLPHVEVSVTFRGRTVKQRGCHFIDAIHFLCQAEEVIRHILSMRRPVDFAVTKRTNENLRRLLEAGEAAS